MQHVEWNTQLQHMVLLSCKGQNCGMCGNYATHKVEQDQDEAVSTFSLDGVEHLISFHPYTQYVCCKCFAKIMGPAVQCGNRQ